MSKGSDRLYGLLKASFPGKKIIKEYTFSNNLRLDFYMPELNMAWEYDGPQHEKYIGHFFSNKSEFYIAQNRDEQKEYICGGLGIKLARINSDEQLNLKTINRFYGGGGSGKIQPGYEKYLPKKVLAKQSQKSAYKNAYQKYKQSDAYQTKKEKAREWCKNKRLEHKKVKLS